MTKILTLFFAAALAAGSLATTASAQTSPPDVRAMIASVKETADQLRTTLDALPQKMEEAIRSPEAAEQTLSELGETVRGIQALLADNGELWKKHVELSEFTDARTKLAQEHLRNTGEQRWKEQVDRWGLQRVGLRKVRDDIIKERERTKLWLENVERDRAFLIDALVLRQVEVAVAELRKSADGMKKMNDGMDNILKELQSLPMSGVPN